MSLHVEYLNILDVIEDFRALKETFHPKYKSDVFYYSAFEAGGVLAALVNSVSFYL